MKLILILAIVAAVLPSGVVLSEAAPVVILSEAKDLLSPPAAWNDADPADSLYRAARRALNEKDYELAARLFESVASKFPRSEYAPDALYWKGFALNRNGNLDDAAEALEAQARRYPNAATRGDASTLLIQIKGQLAKRGDASATRDVNEAAAQSGRTCTDMETQIAALDALQQMDAERVVPLLRRVLARRDACSVPLRKNAVFILAQKSGDDREKILLDVVKSDPSTDVKSDAVFQLSQAKSDAAVEALEYLLLKGEERSVRENALFALANNRSDRARKAVKAFALSDDIPAALRSSAVFHVAQSRNADDIAWLKEAYAKISEPEVRGNILFHLASRPGPETTKWLLSVLVDSKEQMEQRKNAMFHLAQRKVDGSDGLVAAYDKLPIALKKDLLFHIAQRRDAASLEKLISIAKTDPNAELRKDALFHIGQSKDPRALKALEEIVNP